MKILELRFKNLNSLSGEWLIDFTEADYVSTGIFSLTGPTGAGKSTILDAICLALYGQTPRLGKITKTSNDIMSRHTGECYAEVLFEAQSGGFRCHWQQRRARKKAEGKLQETEHQIFEAATGTLIESKKSLVLNVVEEKTGMDFERFTRSILLAQGGFDTFLKADDEQKSKMLEQITGSEIYSTISRCVHERQRDEKDQLKTLQAETAGVVILSDSEEKTQQQALAARQKDAQTATETAAKIQDAIAWLATLDALKQDINTLLQTEHALDSDLQAFQAERKRLDWALKAAALEGLYAPFSVTRTQQAEDRQLLAAEKKSLPALALSVAETVHRLQQAKQQLACAQEEQQTAVPLIRKIRALDQTLADQQTRLVETATHMTDDLDKMQGNQRALAKAQVQKSGAKTEAEQIAEYLRDNTRDEWLVGGLAGVEEQLGQWQSKQQERLQKEAENKQLATRWEIAKSTQRDCVTARKTCQQALVGELNTLQREENVLSDLLAGRLLREYRSEKEHRLREMAFLSKISELEDHRAHLEADKPCPLCGATTHPFATGAIPEADASEREIEKLTQRISRTEAAETVIKRCEQAVVQARQELAGSEHREVIATQDKKGIEQSQTALKEGLAALDLDGVKLQQAVLAKLKPLGITAVPDQDVSVLLRSLRKRLQDWQAQNGEKMRIETQLSDIAGDMMRLNSVIDTQKQALEAQQNTLALLQQAQAISRDERQSAYGQKNPEEEEQRLDKALSAYRVAENSVQTEHVEQQQALASAQVAVNAVEQRIQQRVVTLSQAEKDFSAALSVAEFLDEAHFSSAKLSAERREVLSAQATTLADRKTAWQARKKDAEARLLVETARQVTEKSVAALIEEQQTSVVVLQQISEDIVAYKHALRDHEAAKVQLREKGVAIARQRQACDRWTYLNALIGSADGKKYRNFAQGITFEMMVFHANQQLEKMTDRYQLVRDDSKPLALNVIDYYQGDDIRPTRNLSGGESFIVSLALALGLSKMASRKVRVDSLFLDEGFGSLSEDALDTALETLSGLHQEGKLIGLISHVSAVQERIGTQITVSPGRDGCSELSGPGCRKL